MSKKWSKSDAKKLENLLARYEEYMKSKKKGGCDDCGGSVQSANLDMGNANRAKANPMLGYGLSGGYKYPIDNKEFNLGYYWPTNQQDRYNVQSAGYQPYNQLPDKYNDYREVYKMLGYLK